MTVLVAPPRACDLPTWIEGQEVMGPTHFEVRYPHTNEVIGSAPRLTREEVGRVLDTAATRRFDLSRYERAQLLNRIAGRLEAEADDFATLITLESGLALTDTRYELRRTQDVFRFAAPPSPRDDGQVFASDTPANGPSRRAYTLREPLRLAAIMREVEPIADAFAQELAAEAAKLKVGDPLDPETDVGTVIGEAEAAEFARRITLLSGGERRGAQITPTVLDHVRPEMELVACETFEPYAPIIRVPDLDAAHATANQQDFGLAAGVVTNGLQAINRCIRELRVGSVNIREVPGYRTELTPFGGTKDSGLGVKEGVIEAMKAMTFVKLYTLPWE